MDGFAHSRAYVIGIDQYAGPLPPLQTAAGDARSLAAVLKDAHHYDDVQLLVDAEATQTALMTLLTQTLPQAVGADDRVLVYFAGHGVALDGDDGPAGYLLPQDARAQDPASFLPMQAVQKALATLPCRHLLLILDCCFAGAFRWAATRGDAVIAGAVPLYQERYDRFVHDPAWQVLTSAAYDQRALDVLNGLGGRGGAGDHSPFALKLFDALQGAADLMPKDGDGVITATELYCYLRDCIEAETLGEKGKPQTPGLWPLPKHGKGEYIFLVPGKNPHLPPAPPLLPENNPYRGLASYDAGHKDLFFGRDKEIADLTALVQRQGFTAVLGASGTGKSSLVNAGLVPALAAAGWTVLGPIRPGATPLQMLNSVLPTAPPGILLAGKLARWRAEHPQTPVLLVIDQFEECLTLCRSDAERDQFLHQVADALAALDLDLHLVLTLRSDFEPQFTTGADAPLAAHWAAPGARYVVPPMAQDDLRRVIEGPAEAHAIYFKPDSLVDELINEVVQTPNALPLLSFTLSEMYLSYFERHGDDRSLTDQDYQALHGVVGSLCQRANAEYARLDAAGRATLQAVMLRMVALEGGQRTRRRVPLTELDYGDPAENARVNTVIEQFTTARLVTKGSDETGSYVEPVHDALIQGWDQLWTWTRDQAGILPLQRRITAEATEWDRTQGSSDRRLAHQAGGLLWDDDPQLDTVIALQKKQRLRLNRQEAAFIRASSARKRRNQQIRNFFVALLGVIAVVALLAAWFAVDRGQQAAVARDIALAQSRVAQAQQLAAQSVAQAPRDPEVGLLLAMEAVSTTLRLAEPVVPQAEDALHQGLLNPPLLAALPVSGESGSPVGDLAWSPDGASIFTAGTDGQTRVWDAAGHQQRFALAGNSAGGWAAWSPDGRQICAPDAGGNPRLYDATTGREGVALAGGDNSVQTVLWSPDGTRILAVGQEGATTIWDAASGRTLVSIPGLNGVRQSPNGGVVPTDAPPSAAWSPDGTRIALIRADGIARVWDAATGQERFALDGLMTSVAWSPDGRSILTGGEDGTARIWDAAGGQERAVLRGHTGLVTRAVWSPDGLAIVTTSTDRTAKIWDVGSSLPRATLTGHTDSVTDAAWSPDGQEVLTAGEDQTARVWDARSGLPLYTLAGHNSAVRRIAWSPDGRNILTGAEQETSVRLWEAARGSERAGLQGTPGTIIQFTWSPDGNSVLTINDVGVARVWDTGTGQARFALNPQGPTINYAVWSHDGRYIATTADNATAAIWDAARGTVVQALSGPAEIAPGVAWSPDDKYIAALTGDRQVQVWDAAGGQQRVAVAATAAWAALPVWSPDSRSLLVASDDGTAAVWSIADGRKRFMLPSPEPLDPGAGHNPNYAAGMDWSPDGLLLATSTSDGTTQIWDATTGQERFKLDISVTTENGVRWSPDSRYLLTVNDDNTVSLWNAADGKEAVTLAGHTDAVLSAAWSGDGRRILTTSGRADGSARVWDAETGQVRFILPGYTGRVTAAAWSPDSGRIFSAGADGTTRQYMVGIGDLLALAQSRVTRTLTPQERFTYFLEPLPTPARNATPSATP
jgi:WD40 repeat protein